MDIVREGHHVRDPLSFCLDGPDRGLLYVICHQDKTGLWTEYYVQKRVYIYYLKILLGQSGNGKYDI